MLPERINREFEHLMDASFEASTRRMDSEDSKEKLYLKNLSRARIEQAESLLSRMEYIDRFIIDKTSLHLA